MRTNLVRLAAETPDQGDLAALARLESASAAVLERDLGARNSKLEAQALHYQTALDAIAQGVCLFDGEKRLNSEQSPVCGDLSARARAGSFRRDSA